MIKTLLIQMNCKTTTRIDEKNAKEIINKNSQVNTNDINVSNDSNNQFNKSEIKEEENKASFICIYEIRNNKET